MNKENNSNYDDELVRIESNLIEQEHRPIVLIKNYLSRKKKWELDDKRREAASKAIVWRLFFSPTTIAFASGGLLGLFTIYFLYQQNILLENQNFRIEQQTNLVEASRRSSQMFIMGEVLSDINSELEADGNSTRTLSNTLVGRIVGLSRSMKPYRYLENDVLISEPISPERGQLLITLKESNIDADLLNNIHRKSIFSYADLREADFRMAFLQSLRLQYSDLRDADLRTANLIDANLKGADLRGADLRETNFRYIDSMDNVKVDRYDWLIYIKDSLSPNSKGVEELIKTYRVDSVYYKKHDKTIPTLTRIEKNKAN